MAGATLELPDGTKITITGDPHEVAVIVDRLQAKDADGPRKRRPRRKTGPTSAPGAARRTDATPRPTGVPAYIRELISEDFFASKQTLKDVQSKLAERAHIYPVTSLSPVMTRLVRNRELRRLKETGLWRYVNV